MFPLKMFLVHCHYVTLRKLPCAIVTNVAMQTHFWFLRRRSLRIALLLFFTFHSLGKREAVSWPLVEAAARVVSSSPPSFCSGDVARVVGGEVFSDLIGVVSDEIAEDDPRDNSGAPAPELLVVCGTGDGCSSGLLVCEIRLAGGGTGPVGRPAVSIGASFVVEDSAFLAL